MSRKNRSVVHDLIPDLGELAGMARSIIANRHQGPLHRLGFNVEDIQNYAALPYFRRARDYHLHDIKGRRYLDFSRGDGTHLLGYSVPHSREALKNRINQGTFHGLPHVSHQQLMKTLGRLFPRHVAVVCPDRYRIQSVMDILGVKTDRPMVPLREDLAGLASDDSFAFWLPFSMSPGLVSIALLPSLSLQGPFVLLVERQYFQRQLQAHGKDAGVLEQFLDVMLRQVPAWSLSPLMSGLQALEVLGAFAGYAPGPDALGAMSHPLTKDLQGRLGIWREAWWLRTSLGPSWQRVGPYLMHNLGPAEYAGLFKSALDQGVLLNPRCAGLNVIPGIMSDGELALVRKILEA